MENTLPEVKKSHCLEKLIFRNLFSQLQVPCVGTVFLKFIKRNTTEIKRLTHERL